jgi:outer membrane protein W
MCFVFIPAYSFQSFAQEGASLTKLNYVTFKGGIYTPTNDLDEFDNGVYADIMYNRYLTKNIVLEAGIGLYGTEATYNGVKPVLGSFTEKDSIVVNPIKLNLKWVFPFPIGEFYVGAGIGFYLAYAEAEVTSTGLGYFSMDDSDVVIGGQLKAGVIFNLNKIFFLGIEGEYMVTDTAQFSGSAYGVPLIIETDLDGYIVNGVFGFRF